jgi:hypothetical protein
MRSQKSIELSGACCVIPTSPSRLRPSDIMSSFLSSALLTVAPGSQRRSWLSDDIGLTLLQSTCSEQLRSYQPICLFSKLAYGQLVAPREQASRAYQDNRHRSDQDNHQNSRRSAITPLGTPASAKAPNPTQATNNNNHPKSNNNGAESAQFTAYNTYGATTKNPSS